MAHRIGKQHTAPVGGAALPEIDIANVRRVTDLECELAAWGVDSRTIAIINVGHHPDPDEADRKAAKLGKAPSRSEWLWDVCCNLVRCGVPDEVVYAIITDPTWKISESVLDKKSGAHRYALRQIASAKEEVEDGDLAHFNNRFCVLEHEAKTPLVLSWQPSELNEQVLVPHFATLEGFQQRYEHIQKKIGTSANGEPKYMQLGKWWRYHEKRRQYPGIRFEPSGPEVLATGHLNLWRGYGVQPIAGDRGPHPSITFMADSPMVTTTITATSRHGWRGSSRTPARWPMLHWYSEAVAAPARVSSWVT